jgi:NAD(P)H-hydrate epimerase
MIVDADGLNALAANMPATFQATGPRILTPHPGEFERLSNVSRADRKQQISAAIAFAQKGNLVLVLKGSETVITDGSTTIVNHTGNPKMAVGGSGDCLTGIIAAMVCQGLPPLKAAHLGTALHGMAGDIAAERLACPSILATDLIDDLPEAFCRIARDPR